MDCVRRFVIYKLLFFVACLFFFSCRKKDGTDVSYLSSVEKSYCFLQGSYWVFQNDSDQTLDSIVLTRAEHNFFWAQPPIKGNTGLKMEFYKMDMTAYPQMYAYNDFVTPDLIRRNGGGDFGQLGQPVFVNEETGFNGLSVVDNHIPSLTLSTGNTFVSVHKLKITASEQYQHEFDHDTYLYYTPSVGIIKKETEISAGTIQSWSLLRWHVQKAF